MKKALMLMTLLGGVIMPVRVLAEKPAIPFLDALDAAAVVEPQVCDLNREALTVGNGDLNALVWERSGTLCLRVAKNDIWDARIDTSADPVMLKVDLSKQTWSGGGGNVPSWGRPYPTPRGAGIVRIGGGKSAPWHCIRAGGKENAWTAVDGGAGVMSIEGVADASAGWQMDLPAEARACTEVRFKISGTPGAKYYVTLNTSAGTRESGWKETPGEATPVIFAAPAGSHVTGVIIYVQTVSGKRVENRISGLVAAGGGAECSLVAGIPPDRLTASRLDLRRAVATVGEVSIRALAGRNAFLIETEGEVSFEPLNVGHLPRAEVGETGGVKWLRMKMPGDLDYAGMEYAMAAAANGKRKAVAVLTSRDVKHGDVLAAAITLARETANADVAGLVAAHEAEWADYWSASGVRLGDADFQLWWYRMAYMLRCFSKPGVVPAGLWAFQPNDAPNWHGDYHHNYNAWQPYWTPLVLNHPDQTRPWIDYMNEMLPRLKWFAKETYGCEGAFVGISSFAYEPDPAVCKSKNRRQVAMAPWGYTMGMIGMSAQVLWWHHLYQPDRAKLEKEIYPEIKEAALFFCSFAERCPKGTDGRVKYGPSYSPEHGGFGVHNVPFDLAYARFTLKAAITASGELGRDTDLAERFRKSLALLPDYPTAPDAVGKPVVVDWVGCGFRAIGEHNITVPAVPVFPGDQITCFSPEPDQELFRNTLRQTHHRGCNSTVMLSVGKARIGLPEAFDDLKNYYKPQVQPNGMFYWPLHGFYLAESVGVAAGISEFLLQSVEGVIRVFPAWPKEKDAEFARLRAQGGFLVSAVMKGGKVVAFDVMSTVGGKLRAVDPATGKIVERDTRPGETVRLGPV